MGSADYVDKESNVAFINNRCYILDPENGIENPEDVFLGFIRNSEVIVEPICINTSYLPEEFDQSGSFYKVYHRLRKYTYMEFFISDKTLCVGSSFMDECGLELSQKNWGLEYVLHDLCKKYLGWNVRNVKFTENSDV